MTELRIRDILPKSDILESGYLESMLTNLSSSYKLFWFNGVFREVLSENTEISYKKLVARMIATAWFPTIYYKLSLGYNDKLGIAIKYINEELHLDRESKENEIIEFICNSTDKKLNEMIVHFTKLVPQRLIRPFYQREIDFEKKYDDHFVDYKVDRLIEKYNSSDENNALYIMDRLNQTLHVNATWYSYLRTNAVVIEGWLSYKMVRYIQDRNPNVPAIPLKIYPPTLKDRSLTSETKYWMEIMHTIPLYDIYTGEQFNEQSFAKNGGMSIDHFIPWSFVLHNKIWNLYPMFRNMNSSKNNKLPDKNLYLNKFCDYQYDSFMATKKLGNHKNILDQYLILDSDIINIEASDRGHDAFSKAMKNTIEPLYQIANNQGYGIWWY